IFDYAQIDHFKNVDQYGPVGATFATGTVWNADILDDEGWPNSSLADNKASGAGFRVPSSTDFSGSYVLTWTDDGEIQFTLGTCTVNAALSSNYTEVSNGRYRGTNARIVLTYSGPRQLIAYHINRTDRSSTGAFIRRVKFYRLEDEADLLAGKVFRRGW